MICELEDKIFDVQEQDFQQLALEIFNLQYSHNGVYRAFTDALRIDPRTVNNVASIPFLPVSFFKNHEVVTGTFTPDVIFESSGTTQTGNSRHIVKSAGLYRKSFSRCFELFYGLAKNWCIIGLLPSYLERKNSSLVMMVNELIGQSGHADSGFYLDDLEKLADLLKANQRASQKTLLIGVTFALLDLAEKFQFPLHHTTVMETGGMKGRRKEITREEMHKNLKAAWSLNAIHSEYGMTELLSQGYSFGEGLFKCPPWMKIILRDEDDPLTVKERGEGRRERSGLINVIDLANIHSCSFIATDDIGKLHNNGTFEVLGRMDSSDVRGCSLMYTS
ncbi:MAG: acyl transferase [Chitinophagaceae bacterium]|nr:acyl transferase [Chitinophagaceae bacterium]